jgi:hypothetical protein
MKILLFLFFCITLSNIAQSNLELTKNEFSSIFPDTAKVEIIGVPLEGWWDRNEGTFLGALFAGLIALISVLMTNYFNKRTKFDREKEVYCGMLFAIKTELEYHHKSFPHLIQELQAILERSIEVKDIIINKPSRDISVMFLKEIRGKILSLENYNSNVFRVISSYINKCELINSDIQFERIIRLNQKVKNDPTFEDSIRGYFDKVIEEIKKVSLSIEYIFSLINDDLTSLGKVNKHPEIDELNNSSTESQPTCQDDRS